MTVYRHKRGSWHIAIELGKDADGKRLRYQKIYHGTKKDAEEEEARIRQERRAGHFVAPSQITVAQFLQRWLTYMTGRVSESTLSGYREIVANRWNPALGSQKLQQLSVDDIANVEASWLKERSGKTVLNYHRVLAHALADAKRWKVIPTNPAAKENMEPPQYQRKPMASLTLDEALRFRATLEDERHGTALYVLMATGMRVGELLGLAWQDVDLDAGLLTIQQALNRKTGRFADVKTHRSRRPIAMDAELSTLLRRHKIAQLDAQMANRDMWAHGDCIPGCHGRVFCDGLGHHLTHDTIRRAMERCLRAAGLEHMSPHGLRHTHASLLVRLGTHMRVVQERLGHASYAITADTYSHVQPGMDASAAAALGRALKGSG